MCRRAGILLIGALAAWMFPATARAEPLDRAAYQRSIDAGDCEAAQALVLATDDVWATRVAASYEAGKDDYYRNVILLSRWYSDIGETRYPDLVFCIAMNRIARGRSILAELGQPTPYFVEPGARDHLLDRGAALALDVGVMGLGSLSRREYVPALIELARLYEEGVVIVRSPRAAYALLQIAGAPAEADDLADRLAEQLSAQERERLARIARLYKEGIFFRVEELATPELWVEEPLLRMDGDCRRLEEMTIRNAPDLRHLMAPRLLESSEQLDARSEAAHHWRQTRSSADYPALAICDAAGD